MDSLIITIYLEVASTVKGPASDLNSEPQVISIVDTANEDSTTNSKEKKSNVQDPAPPAFEGVDGGEEPQETEGRASPASDGLHIRSEQENIALGALQFVGYSPKSPAGVIGMPDGK